MTSARRPGWDPEAYAANARFVSDLGQPVLELLDPRPGERILDLGCGDGALTSKLQSLGCTVVGIDASAAMVEAARRLGIDARLMSGDALAFDGEFNAVFSNAALHWIRQQPAVIDGVWRALRPGGRFVAEMGGHGNIASIVGALERAFARRGQKLRNPWFFPTVAEYRERLEHRGFEVRRIESFTRPTPLPGDIHGWLDAFGAPLIGDLEADTRGQVARELHAALEPRLRRPDGTWVVDYVRLRFDARRPLSASRPASGPAP